MAYKFFHPVNKLDPSFESELTVHNWDNLDGFLVHRKMKFKIQDYFIFFIYFFYIPDSGMIVNLRISYLVSLAYFSG